MDESATGEANLRVGHVFSRAWAAYKSRFWLALGVSSTSAVLVNLPQIMPANSELTSPTRFVVFAVVQPALMVGVYRVALAIARFEDAEFFMMFDGFTRWPRAIGVFWLYFLVILIGSVLLVVPGIIWAVGFAPAFFVVMDADEGVVGSLRRAWRLTRGYKWRMLLLMLAVAGLNLLGVLFLIVGVFFTLALTNIVYAVAYEELVNGDREGETLVVTGEVLAA